MTSEIDARGTPSSKLENPTISQELKVKRKGSAAIPNNDTITPSENRLSHLFGSVDCDQPRLNSPSKELVSGNNLNIAIKTIQSNPWFAPSYLALFTAILNSLLDMQRLIHFQDAQNELQERDRAYEKAKTGASLAREIANNQAKEHMLNAISSFASSAIAVGSVLQMSKNLGEATTKVENEIKAQEAKLATLQGPTDVDKLKKQQDIVDSLTANKSTNIRQETIHADNKNQQITDAAKQSMTGITQVLISINKTDTGVKEELLKLNEGMIQAINKYMESLAKSRDEAASNFSRFLDFMNKFIESNFKAHSLSGRA